MNKVFFICLIALFFIQNNTAQNINPKNIEIVRDDFGIPHIFAKTDAEVIYGMAWAQCEDNFEYMQDFFAASRNKAGENGGPEAAGADFVSQMFQVRKFVDERYEKDISPKFKKILQAYLAAINKYVETHPEELKIKGIFPAEEKDILHLYVLNFIFMNNAAVDIGKVTDNKMELYKTMGTYKGAGSNAMAFSSAKTSDGKTYLVGNPHQPVEGPVAFWEVSLHSEEGLDIHGVTFQCGGVVPVIAANKNLAWTHTTNYDDYSDVYELTMHPSKKNQYKYDGKWLELEKGVVKFKVKIGPFKIPIKKKYYTSIYGPTYKNKSGYYSFRNNAFVDLGAAEQWYWMNKASNIDEFWDAIKLQKIASQTITYVDKEDNILHIDNGIFPKRDPNFNWLGLLPGDTSATLYDYQNLIPADEIPFIQNPKAGFVYNCNNTVFKTTAENENLKPKDYPASMGLAGTNTHRANRFMKLLEDKDKLSFKDIKSIRDDVTYQLDNLDFRSVMNLSEIINFDLEKYPDLKDVQDLIDRWNGKTDIKNKQAAFFNLMSMHIELYLYKNYAVNENYLPESLFVEAARFAKKFLKKHHGTLEIQLGKVQKVVRGDLELPMYGGTQTLANCHAREHKDGKIKLYHGDTFIMYACYDKSGLSSLKTINLYGNSNDPDSPHYDDQLEMYTKKQLKEIPITKEAIYKVAKKTYHPM